MILKKVFFIIVDEASDSSHRQQLSLVLRFVDCDMNVRGEFISFLLCKWGLTGKQHAKLILEALDALTRDYSKEILSLHKSTKIIKSIYTCRCFKNCFDCPG